MNLGGRITSRGSHCSLLVRAAGQRSARLSYLSSVAFVVMSAVDIAAKAVFTVSSTSATHGITVGQIIVRKMKVLDDAPPASVAQRGI